MCLSTLELVLPFKLTVFSCAETCPPALSTSAAAAGMVAVPSDKANASKADSNFFFITVPPILKFDLQLSQMSLHFGYVSDAEFAVAVYVGKFDYGAVFSAWHATKFSQ